MNLLKKKEVKHSNDENKYDIIHHKDYNNLIKKYENKKMDIVNKNNKCEKLLKEVNKLTEKIEDLEYNLKYFDITNTEQYKYLINSLKNKKVKKVKRQCDKRKCDKIKCDKIKCDKRKCDKINYDEWNITDWSKNINNNKPIRLLENNNIYPFS